MKRALILLAALYALFTGFEFPQSRLPQEKQFHHQLSSMFQQNRDTKMFQWKGNGSYATLNLKLDQYERIIQLIFIDNENLMIVSSEYTYIYNLKKGEMQKSGIGITANNLLYPGIAMEIEDSDNYHIFTFRNIFTGDVQNQIKLSDKWNWVSPDGAVAVSINYEEKEMLLWDRTKEQGRPARIDYSEWGRIAPVDIYDLTYNTILYNASGVSILGEAFHFAVGICNSDASVNNVFEHYGVKVFSYNGSSIFACNTNEFSGSDQCKTIYKVVQNQPVSTKIPIGIYTGLTFDGKYIFSFDSLPPTRLNANSGISSNYVINVYDYGSEELVNSCPLTQSVLKGYQISPHTQALTVDGSTAAFLDSDTGTVFIVRLNTIEKGQKKDAEISQ